MPASEDLRGSAPIYSAKDVLVRVDAKLDGLDSKVDGLSQSVAILLSQDLGTRVTAVENWQNRVIGLASSARVLGVVASLLSIAALALQLLNSVSG